VAAARNDGRRVRRLLQNDATPAVPTTVATTTSTAASAYVARLNELCAELEPQVIDAYGGAPHPAPFPIKEFNDEYPKLIAVTEAFDAKADAIPVAPADRSAADAFEAYRRESDAAYAQMAAAAATGEQDRFDAAWHAVHRMFDNSSTLRDPHAAGITCNAR
jgi:hypothetical protein